LLVAFGDKKLKPQLKLSDSSL